MGVDAFVVRHATAGVHARLASVARSGVAIVNAGEAHVSHPTQGLLDALTIRAHKGPDLSRSTVAICGDLRHSRVAASAIAVLTTLGVGELRLVAPPELLPERTGGARCVADLDAGLAGCDVIMMLRIQRERIVSVQVPDDAEYHRRFGLTAARLALADPACIVMHPGPVNRGVELASEVMDGPRSVILEQVANGVAVRMAVLEALLGARR
jgi:aspartate carbamoyltransferase catalytic subunit